MARVDPISSALASWMPRLIGVYRTLRRSQGPADHLLPHEVAVVARGIRKLSLGLTRERQLVGGHYMDDPELLAAYLLYFWPISYAKARHAYGEIGARPRTVLDLGSGPGPLALAAFDAGAAEVMGADRSTPALDLARRIAGTADRVLQTRPWDPLSSGEIPGGDQAWSVISLGHILNELWTDDPDRIAKRVELCRTLMGRLRKGGSLLIIEPSLQITTREMLEVRDRLVAEGCPVRAPCLFRGPCPALDRPAEWCHAERSWTPPAALKEIFTAAGLHQEAIKMAYLVMGRPGETWPVLPDGRLFRVVSEHLPGKGRTRVMGCGPEGRIPLAIADDALSPRNRALLDAQRGDVVDVQHASPANEGPGLRITSDAHVRIAASGGQSVGARH
jgi:SAM-dependent methyltransferase